VRRAKRRAPDHRVHVNGHGATGQAKDGDVVDAEFKDVDERKP
jgi:hypothetical protein